MFLQNFEMVDNTFMKYQYLLVFNEKKQHTITVN